MHSKVVLDIYPLFWVLTSMCAKGDNGGLRAWAAVSAYSWTLPPPFKVRTAARGGLEWPFLGWFNVV